MSDVVITVRGEHETRVAPERAVVHLSVRAEGPDRGPVVERMAAISQPVRDELAARRTAGVVEEWSSQRIAVWSDRPWAGDGKRLAPVHYASVDLTATFSDFAALSSWVGDLAERDGVQIGSVDWELTPATRAETERRVATEAVSAAVARATAYAGALGLADVAALEIADVGLLVRGGGNEGAPAPRMMRAMAVASDMGGAPAVDLQPADLVVSSAVEARFTAR